MRAVDRRGIGVEIFAALHEDLLAGVVREPLGELLGVAATREVREVLVVVALGGRVGEQTAAFAGETRAFEIDRVFECRRGS